ncbi:flagellar hook-associated protein FlgK [Bacillaceae bacterium CLA-AA-H227]|uniref:Flagellar hook-associated protein FlgK n=1 Tax=Robertmurraya yapensis (ex Hitch et al 2024) TaxID=3133160 RepID=A0ACC6SBW0_9BACI
MASTFMGLETARRGLTTQQSALYTVGHNISNANTLGYTRQRVNMQATGALPYPGLNSGTGVGQLGTGVEAGSVQRIRDKFLDVQYRQENTKLGYWGTKSDAISQMEDVLSEPSEYGLNESFDQFYQSLQDLSTNSSSSSARKVVLQRAAQLADSFNYLSTQLTQIQGNLKSEIINQTDEVNSIIKQIGELNAQIARIEPNGYLSNDLYDARDVLIDQLSEFFPLEVSYTSTGGNALPISEGTATIKINGVVVVDGKQVSQLQAVDSAGAELINDGNYVASNGFVVSAAVNVETIDTATLDYSAGTAISANSLANGSGKMAGLIHSYGYKDASNNDVGVYPKMLQDLDKLASEFIKTFNNIHTQGFTLATDSSPSINGGEFFTGTSAKDISVSSLMTENSIAASSSAGEEGNGSLAILLSNIKSLSFDGASQTMKLADGTDITVNVGNLDGASPQTFYSGLIAQLGTDGQQANRMVSNATTIQLSVENNRSAVSSVSLDEEMTDMIKFQQAYNASARMITSIDEILDKIINGMGRVGL